MRVGDLVRYNGAIGDLTGAMGIITESVALSIWVYVLWSDGTNPEAISKSDLEAIK